MKGKRFSSHGFGQCDGFFDRAICDRNAFDPRVMKGLWVMVRLISPAPRMRTRQLSSWPKIFSAKSTATEPTEVDPRLDIGVRADAFSDAKSVLKEPVKSALRGSLLLCQRVSFFNLAEDFSLSKHH